MNEPILIINLKTYPEGTGKNATKLLKAAEACTNDNIILAVQAIDIRTLSKKTKVPIFAQHVDAMEEGNKTGHLTIHSIKDAGAQGTLINHSEHRISEEQIKKTIELCKKYNLLTVLCAETPEEAEKFSIYSPDFIAIEPPELIGGDISVSRAKPEVITNTVNKVPTIKVLCGAGVKTKDDAKKAIELGSKGLLVASGIVKAKQQKKAIKELLDGMTGKITPEKEKPKKEEKASAPSEPITENKEN
ncbi:MAG: triose-phosphate isomerase [Candidatus Woesearchaeota archaeon]|jgi:triosephosphate isomerase